MKLVIGCQGKTLDIIGNPGKFCENLFQSLKPVPTQEGISPPYRPWKLPLNERTKDFLDNCQRYGTLKKNWEIATHDINIVYQNINVPLLYIPRRATQNQINTQIAERLRNNFQTLYCYFSLPKETILLWADMIEGIIPEENFPLYINDPYLEEYIAGVFKE